MVNKVTKKGILAGKGFTIKDDIVKNTVYKFEPNLNTQGIIASAWNKERAMEGKYDSYVCNILKIGTKTIKTFRFLFNKKVAVMLHYENLEYIDNN